MGFSQDESWNKLAEILQRDLPLSEAWAAFVDFHVGIKDKPFWESLRSIDLNKGREEIVTWLNELSTTDPLPESLAALWFGIITVYDEVSRADFYAYYVHGTDGYDSDGIDWAMEPTYQPENRYHVNEIVNVIREHIKHDQEDFNFFDWIFPLAYTTFLLNDVLEHHVNKPAFLASRAQLNAAVGYDNGDFVNLRPICKS